MQFILPWVWLLVFVIGLAFIARMACAIFSEKARQRVKRSPILHALWSISGIFAVLFLMDPFFANIWPPHWLELKRQREIVRERVQAAGGWEKLRQDCITFANTNQNEAFFWIRWNTNHVNLPATMSALDAQVIRYSPPSMLSKDNPDYPVVHIKIFGMHSTGGHSIPFYGLEVIPGQETSPSQNSGFHYQKIIEGVYEVY
jgi:hypothetical protein